MAIQVVSQPTKTGIKRIVFLDFIYHLVSQEERKLKIITYKR